MVEQTAEVSRSSYRSKDCANPEGGVRTTRGGGEPSAPRPQTRHGGAGKRGASGEKGEARTGQGYGCSWERGRNRKAMGNRQPG